MSRLKNKTALITGGTSGIGLETARQFVAQGARVIVTGANPVTIEQAREDLGPDVTVIPSDAGDVSAQKDLAAIVGETFGKLDILFANAGILDARPLEDWDEAGFDRTMAIHVKGPLFLVQALLPIFTDRASIVLCASTGAHIGFANAHAYSASKAALTSLARTLSAELLGRGIRANSVIPGPITTPIYDKLGLAEADWNAASDAMLTRLPIGRFGTVAEVASAVVFLASNESSYIVGSEITIDGGMCNL